MGGFRRGDGGKGAEGERDGVRAPFSAGGLREWGGVLPGCGKELAGCFGRSFPVCMGWSVVAGFGAAAVVGDGSASAGVGVCRGVVGGGLDIGGAGLGRRGAGGLGVGGGGERGDGLDGLGVARWRGLVLGGVLGGVGRGLGAFALKHGEKNVGETGAARVFGFSFGGDGSLFEVDEDAEEGDFAVEEGFDEGVGDGLLTGAGALEEGLGEVATVPGAGGRGGGFEVVVVGRVRGGDGIIDVVEVDVRHECSQAKEKRDAGGRPVGGFFGAS